MAKAILFLFLCGCNVDKSFIFFPNRIVETTPADVGLFFEDISLVTKDHIRINGWLVPHPKAKGTLLWFHGNGGNISDRITQIKRFHAALPVHIMIVDYRGYGKSEGDVSEEGTYLDAEAAYDYLLTRSDTGGIIVYGQSLGAAVAMDLAIRRPKANRLILEAPFLSIREMAKVHYGWLPVGGLITTQYDNIKKIRNVRVPVLILHGDQDETVPYEHGQLLFGVANAPKRFYSIPNAHHNDTYEVGGAAYMNAITAFLVE